MSDTKIVICPKDPTVGAPTVVAVERCLIESGLVLPKTDDSRNQYEQGPEFLNLIQFRSSHTLIILGEGLKEVKRLDSREACWVEIPEPTEEIEFLGSASTEDPTCPSCGFTNEDWPETMNQWYEAKITYKWQCPKCQSSFAPWDLDWRHTCGFGRFSIKIWGVNPGEAAPSAAFMSILEKGIGQKLDWFVYRL